MAALRARFRERAADAKSKLERALTTDDLPEIVRLAHVLVGSGGMFGFPAISAKAEEVELAADARDRSKLQQLMPELLRLLDKANQGR